MLCCGGRILLCVNDSGVVAVFQYHVGTADHAYKGAGVGIGIDHSFVIAVADDGSALSIGGKGGATGGAHDHTAFDTYVLDHCIVDDTEETAVA